MIEIKTDDENLKQQLENAAVTADTVMLFGVEMYVHSTDESFGDTAFLLKVHIPMFNIKG